MEQAIVNPAISLAERVVEAPDIQTQDKTQHVVVGLMLLEIFKVFSQDRVQQRFGKQTIEPPCYFIR